MSSSAVTINASGSNFKVGMIFLYEKITDEDTGETEFEPGDIVVMSLLGIAEAYFNYMRLVIEQSRGSGGPFSTIPAEV